MCCCCFLLRMEDIIKTFTQAQASASWYETQAQACTRTNNQKCAAAVFCSEWKISSRHSPKHRLVLDGMKHKHKAYTRRNNKKYAAAVCLSGWKISRHSPKHRLVLVGMKHQHKAYTRTNNTKYATAVGRYQDIHPSTG